MASEVTIRPMREDDLESAERLSDEGFHELDMRTYPRDWPDPEPRSRGHSEVWVRRTAHILRTDPGGCWVAEDGRGMAGFATSFNRELMWVLATYVVRPGLQGQGVGKQLLAAALHHGRGCLRGMLSASSDPKAVRRYHLAGFVMHPQMMLTGTVDRAVLPVVERVREGTAGDIDLMNSVDRTTRGAAHLTDHDVLVDVHRLVVTDHRTGSGYVYLAQNGNPILLAATNRRTAAKLLWEALAATSPDKRATINHVTAANSWAVDVGMEARLDLHTSGYLGLRGMKPPAPYLHHGAFL